MPAPVIDQLHAEIQRAMADADLLATMAGWGIALSPGTPEAFGQHIAAENRRWKEQVRRLALPLE